MANTASSQPSQAGDSQLSGMAHSEAHYFNRYVISIWILPMLYCADTSTLVIIIMVCLAKDMYLSFQLTPLVSGIHEEMLVSKYPLSQIRGPKYTN